MHRPRTKKKVSAEEGAREELFASESSNSSTARQRKTEEQVAQNVTESLMELRQMMHLQVKRSEDTMHVLVTSSKQVDKSKSEMDTIGANVKVSHGLITKFNRRELTDKFIILLGLVFFIGVVLYILRKRLIGWIL